jgi:hypothetical protein
MNVTIVDRPSVETPNAAYGGSRPPLAASPLIKLPPTWVRARGWLLHQMELMADGMVGHLPELSRFLAPDNGWRCPNRFGWEEPAYWIRGAHLLAMQLDDSRLLMETRPWLEAVLNSQESDGYFGPRALKRVEDDAGRAVVDLWPHMIWIEALIHHYEWSQDERVPAFLLRFFRFCQGIPEDEFLAPAGGMNWRDISRRASQTGRGPHYPWVGAQRGSDILPSIYWLYNQTGAEWLLRLATRFFLKTAPPVSEWLDDHVVNFTQRFAYPGIYGQQSGEGRHLQASEYWYRQHMATWGQQPRGIFAGDERIRSGRVDPRQAFETCGMVEFARSFDLLGRLTGDPLWADRTEDIMLNHFPVSQPPDLKGVKYLTASNQPQLDASSEHLYHNRGRPFIRYSPSDYRCCQHNVGMGWPYYVQNLWQVTADNGLALWLYAPSQVSARAGSTGRHARFEAQTDYPFSGKVTLRFTAREANHFPLYLRVPGWCQAMRVAVNDAPVEIQTKPRHFVRIDRTWSPGDTVSINMLMGIRLTEWPRNGSVTVDRGPLSYSVRIEEEWRRCGGSAEWPEWEVLPASPWNYGLVLDRTALSESLEVVKEDQVPDQPWTVEAAPIEIKARAKRIPYWQLESETVQELQTSPIRSSQREEEIRLIPLGCARLRMACLPVIGDENAARDWSPPTDDGD